VKVLIKLGGTLLDDSVSLTAIARQLAETAAQYQICVVHGGGKQVTRFLDERGIASRFEGGLRVSDANVIDAVTKVIAGTVNKHLVSAVIAAGRSAVGLSGVDGSLTRAEQLNPALENVGKPVATDGHLLDLLLGGGYLPVVACIAGNGRGAIFNVNADAMAVSCAVGWGASRLLFLTDVPGVKDKTGSLLPNLSSVEIAQLISSGVAYGGMQAKLEAAQTAMAAGLQASIVSGAEPNVINRLLSRESIGTLLSNESQPPVSARVALRHD
jgi:acetylglutamate kinase